MPCGSGIGGRAAWRGAGAAGRARDDGTATPELLAKPWRPCPPATDEPDVDAPRSPPTTPPSRLRRFVRPFRRPLGLGLALVMLDALLTLAGPLLVADGLDSGVAKGSAHGPVDGLVRRSRSWRSSDWFVTWVYTRYTGRTAERLLFALRVRIFAHLHRLSVDYYDREMAGRVMTRMTTDVDAFSQLLQSGLLNAIVVDLPLRRRGRAARLPRLAARRSPPPWSCRR